MRKVDIGIIIVLVAAVVFSGIGVATYETAPGGIDYDVTWQESSNAGPTSAELFTGNEQNTFQLNIDQRNLTKVVIRIQGNAIGPHTATTVTARVLPLNATEKSDSFTIAAGPTQGSGNVEIEIPVNAIPTETTASGASDNETMEQLDRDFGTNAGRGTWRVEVTTSGSTSTPLGGAGETNVAVSSVLTFYMASVAVHTPDIER